MEACVKGTRKEEIMITTFCLMLGFVLFLSISVCIADYIFEEMHCALPDKKVLLAGFGIAVIIIAIWYLCLMYRYVSMIKLLY